MANLVDFNDKDSDMNEDKRQRIERQLAQFAKWRASGLPLKAYVQQIGEDLSAWRARLAWEKRWTQLLAGTYTLPQPKSTTAFVKAICPQIRPPKALHHPQATNSTQASICITLNAPGRHNLQASIEWPISQMAHSSAWLREVLA